MYQQTPLILAVVSNRVDEVKLLLDENANVNATDEYQQTALCIAAQNGYAVAERMLLDKQMNG